MTFSKDELQDLREYVSDGGIEDLVTIAPDHITVVSEDFPDRFVVTIGLMTCTKGYGFVLMVEDCRPREDDLGFPYGLPVRVSLPDDKWSLREVVRHALDLLTDVADTAKSLRLAIKGLQEFEKHCNTLNAQLNKVNAAQLFIPHQLARVAARVAAKDPALVELALKGGSNA